MLEFLFQVADPLQVSWRSVPHFLFNFYANGAAAVTHAVSHCGRGKASFEGSCTSNERHWSYCFFSLSLAGTSLMTPSKREQELLVFHVEGVEWGYWSPHPQSTLQYSKSQVKQEARTDLIYTVHEIKMNITAQENFNFLILRSHRNFSRTLQ